MVCLCEEFLDGLADDVLVEMEVNGDELYALNLEEAKNILNVLCGH